MYRLCEWFVIYSSGLFFFLAILKLYKLVIILYILQFFCTEATFCWVLQK